MPQGIRLRRFRFQLTAGGPHLLAQRFRMLSRLLMRSPRAILQPGPALLRVALLPFIYPRQAPLQLFGHFLRRITAPQQMDRGAPFRFQL